MDPMLISNVFLWIVVLCMGVVIYALTRQIGVLYERVAPAGALAINQNLKVGQDAPELKLQTVSATHITVGGLPADGKSQLLFFASPDCPVCKTLIPVVKSAAKAEESWLDLIIASDGIEQDHQSYINQQGLAAYPYVISELLGKTYGVSKLPYAVLIDEDGKEPFRARL